MSSQASATDAISHSPDWHIFEKGKTIGKSGSEGGLVLVDLENIHGARITLEKEGHNAPYAITFGIYGLLFHTVFKTELEQAHSNIAWIIGKIDEVFRMYELREEQRDDTWYTEHDRLVHDLTID